MSPLPVGSGFHVLLKAEDPGRRRSPEVEHSVCGCTILGIGMPVDMEVEILCLAAAFDTINSLARRLFTASFFLLLPLLLQGAMTVEVMGKESELLEELG